MAIIKKIGYILYRQGGRGPSSKAVLTRKSPKPSPWRGPYSAGGILWSKKDSRKMIIPLSAKIADSK